MNAWEVREGGGRKERNSLCVCVYLYLIEMFEMIVVLVVSVFTSETNCALLVDVMLTPECQNRSKTEGQDKDSLFALRSALS